MQEYIITVEDPTIWDTGLWDELTVDGLGDNFIPLRSVEVVNDRPFNEYSAHFNLTAEEAAQIALDPRIQYIELQADLQLGVIKTFSSIRPSYPYDKNTFTTTATMKNWGLWRSIRGTNPFSPSARSISGSFPFTLTGTGVDLIFVGTGVAAGHPEFAVNADGTGSSRVVSFDWSTLGVPGATTPTGGWDGDSDGHDSNCASIAAGNTCGWAPGAAIYSLRIFPGTDIVTGALLGNVNSDLAFDLVRAFHLSKVAAGNTRPTICSNSWSYTGTYQNMLYTVYRSTTHYGGADNAYGEIGSHFPYVVNYLDIAANNCAAAGVILIGSAGNNSHKMDVPGGSDYNNHWVAINFSDYYYHRGGSPGRATSMINVGSVDNSDTEQKANYSETGPRVDIYAPGSSIMGAYANKPYNTPAVADPRNPAYYLNKMSGTSFAAPQVAGYLACVAELRPEMTPEDAKNLVISGSKPGMLDEHLADGTGYTNWPYLQGGTNRYLYQQFNNPLRGTITS